MDASACYSVSSFAKAPVSTTASAALCSVSFETQTSHLKGILKDARAVLASAKKLRELT